ncbi:serine/threonine-protein kinase [Streptomyces sp. CC210A]|uniref:serine/threonine-protein kinase n=1 Tax=Streptomyces sp. CC210A TaxID=2898184 RepID=UPI0022A8C125
MGAGLVLAGRYRLSESIGRGGMGRVWRAHDEVLHRTVAVKELTAGRYVSEADRAVLHARTQKEARAAARISHPSVVTVHDVLEYDDRPWIVMQYVDGPSLADAVKAAGSGRVDPREAARIGLHVLGALGAAHAAGVLHRDVKPGNVLLAKDGRVLLTDFGIAAIEGDSTITRTGELVGSIDYLAPERVRGGAPGPASDLWALGATLYTAVEGASPFRRTSPISTMQAVVTEELPPAAHAGALGPVITALLRKDPADRPAAAEAEHMLVEALEGRAPSATRAYAPPRSVTRDEVREGAAGGRGDGLPDTAGQPSPSQSVTGTLHGRQTASGAPADGPHPAGRSGTRATGTTLHDLTGGTHGPGPGVPSAGRHPAGPAPGSGPAARSSPSSRPPSSARAPASPCCGTPATAAALRAAARPPPPRPAPGRRPRRRWARAARPRAGGGCRTRRASASSSRRAGRARRTATRSTTPPTTAATASASASTDHPTSRTRTCTCWTWNGD